MSASPILAALDFAARKHRHPGCKDAAATPDINHPLALAHCLANAAGIDALLAIASALLHDTVEDTDTSFAELFDWAKTAIDEIRGRHPQLAAIFDATDPQGIDQLAWTAT